MLPQAGLESLGVGRLPEPPGIKSRPGPGITGGQALGTELSGGRSTAFKKLIGFPSPEW